MLKNPDCEKIFPNKSIVCPQIINMSQIIIDVSKSVSIHLYIYMYIYKYISYFSSPPQSNSFGSKRSTQKKIDPPCSQWGSSRYRSTSSGSTCRNRCGHRSWSGWSVGSVVRDWDIIYVIYSITVYIYIYVFFYIYMSCTYLSNCLICLFLYLSIYVCCLIVYMKIAMSWVPEKSRIS